MAESSERVRNTLVVRKSCFGLPTGCPQCLSAYIYLKLAQVPFDVDFHLNYPDSDNIPYFEAGDYVAYNNETGGLIESLKKDVVDIDAGLSSVTDWIPMKVMLTTWLADALAFELWVGGDSSSAYNIYYSGLPWPIGKLLFWKQAYLLKLQYGVNKENAEVKEEEIYSRANSAYDALSTFLGEQNYFFENRPSSLDAIFLAHALITLQALPEASVLRTKLLEHDNLVRYLQKCKTELIDSDPFPTSDLPFHRDASSSASRGHSNWSKIFSGPWFEA
ncbi:mitochondrial outer membrane import complex protein METAXIN isoform X2 [Neltuma alba]|uniref:mitochondrial outer membrane import complex protein METAXIN isoform X2 n=1 Tax=Neltuma alba TaxID=207710 RepID=UPI0010A4FC52|nr:mitochondrial outer membrane import complex protein METAXIN isoform X2 [Prosopis alba]